MDSKDIELKSALDEIFGDDIIELDDDIPVVETKEPTNEELFENTSTLILNPNDFIEPNEEIIANEMEVPFVFDNASNNDVSAVISNQTSNIDSSVIENPLINTSKKAEMKEVNDKNESILEIPFGSDVIFQNNDSSIGVLNDFSVPVLDAKNDVFENNSIEVNINNETKTIQEEVNDISEEQKKEKNSNIPIIKVVIISVIVILLTLIGVYISLNFFGNKDKTIVCSYLFDDKNYKITDEYKITSQNKKITYIEGIYMYTSKTDEYDEQIRYVKEDKLPAIINSNGMKGFTYTYENTDDSIKISSYLDYTIMDENEIKAIDQNTNPISYFKVDVKENSENLTKLFKKQGYKCTSRK